MSAATRQWDEVVRTNLQSIADISFETFEERATKNPKDYHWVTTEPCELKKSPHTSLDVSKLFDNAVIEAATAAIECIVRSSAKGDLTALIPMPYNVKFAKAVVGHILAKMINSDKLTFQMKKEDGLLCMYIRITG